MSVELCKQVAENTRRNAPETAKKFDELALIAADYTKAMESLGHSYSDHLASEVITNLCTAGPTHSLERVERVDPKSGSHFHSLRTQNALNKYGKPFDFAVEFSERNTTGFVTDPQGAKTLILPARPSQNPAVLQQTQNNIFGAVKQSSYGN